MIRKNAWFLGFVCASVLAGPLDASAVPVPAWDDVNAPSRLETGFSPRFDRLPLEATVPVHSLPYADTYWPSSKGGIANRWNSKDPMFKWTNPETDKTDPRVWKMRSPSKAEAMRMTREQLAQLSPTEKWDLLQGFYDYPMTRSILGSTSPLRAYWEGICHGWAPASTNHAEPMPVDVRNPDGVLIPFGSADVKAILDYYYAVGGPRTGLFGWRGPAVRQLGKRCQDSNPGSRDPDCLDANAGSFHIVLANYVGLRGKSFVADVSAGHEVWNNAIYWYKSTIVKTDGPAKGSAPSTVRRLLVETEVRYPSDDERFAPQWNATVGKPQKRVPAEGAEFDPAEYENVYRYDVDNYKYWLELDAAGDIVGGQWVSSVHPDYLWMKNKLEFTGNFAALKRIYKPNPATTIEAEAEVAAEAATGAE